MHRDKTRYVISGLVTLAVFATVAWADLSVGKKAPDFKLPTIRNTQFQLSDCFKEKPKVVVLDLWATWCPPCRHEIPWLVKLHKDYAKKPVQIVGVALDRDLSTVKKFATDNKIRYTVCHDPVGTKLGEPYQIKGIPATYVIDKTGKIRFTHSKFPGDAASQKEKYEEFKKQIDELLAE